MIITIILIMIIIIIIIIMYDSKLNTMSLSIVLLLPSQDHENVYIHV